jgi:predicted dehydrogenase
LSALGQSFEVIGRGSESAIAFEAATKHSVFSGGIEKALLVKPPPQMAIISVSFENLAEVAISLMAAGTRHILLEKPGGLSSKELRSLVTAANDSNANVWVAYNRRFYASTMTARDIIQEDGGPVGCAFEFTEWSHVITPSSISGKAKASWLIANSSHVIDLAFHLCGWPQDWKGWHSGSLDWHPASSRFSGAGLTDKKALFSYHAFWDAPGRWSLEVLTRKRRLLFKPLEQLQIVHLGSVLIESVKVDDEFDRQFKPGLYLETKAFLDADLTQFCTIQDQLKHCAIYDEMAGY